MRLIKIFTLFAVLLSTSCVGVLEGTAYTPIAYDVEPSPPPARHVRNPLPRGEYKDYCRDCNYDRQVLTCTCPSPMGRWQRTSLDTRYCHKPITSFEGRLKCGRPVVAKPTLMPRGPYLENCSDCKMKGSTLICSCKTIFGRTLVTSLDTRACHQSIFNNNGRLTCGMKKEKLPRGSYVSTCNDCEMNNSILSCRCERENGRSMRSTLSTRFCHKKISNDDGKLVCGEVTHKLPRGNYVSSCKDCRVHKGMLACKCRNERGAFQKSTIYADGCSKEISNQNGLLMCGSPRQRPIHSPKPFRSPRPVTLPRGSYTQSCSDCKVTMGTLSCRCPNERGIRNFSSLNVTSCHKSIANSNGLLTCGEAQKTPREMTIRREQTLPRGSYKQSCQDCHLINGQLSCGCTGQTGRTHRSTLRISGCHKSIENCNGELKCGSCTQ